MIIEKEINFTYLCDNSWSGAKDTAQRVLEECLHGVEIERRYHGFGITSDDINLNDQTIKTIENNLEKISRLEYD